MGDIIVQSILMYGLAIVIAVLAAFLIRGIVLFLERRKAQSESVTMAEPNHPIPAPASSPAVGTSDAAISADHVAAIAAAVYAALGAHRVIRIDPVGGHEAGWAVQGRWLHQTSRTPFRK